ncbi:hypothetical protein ZIOFF_047964 [Zingiber officinale]|uniref:Uncharacterized protein n=1 Tax=Zingiber officinale TaxID=94328 RepID=A0A8J5KRL8_ZINOF|nr:hypothetical protein ZIOFF_047964 [Zingiber officinale]
MDHELFLSRDALDLIQGFWEILAAVCVFLEVLAWVSDLRDVLASDVGSKRYPQVRLRVGCSSCESCDARLQVNESGFNFLRIVMYVVLLAFPSVIELLILALCSEVGRHPGYDGRHVDGVGEEARWMQGTVRIFRSAELTCTLREVFYLYREMFKNTLFLFVELMFGMLSFTLDKIVYFDGIVLRLST